MNDRPMSIQLTQQENTGCKSSNSHHCRKYRKYVQERSANCHQRRQCSAAASDKFEFHSTNQPTTHDHAHQTSDRFQCQSNRHSSSCDVIQQAGLYQRGAGDCCDHSLRARIHIVSIGLHSDGAYRLLHYSGLGGFTSVIVLYAHTGCERYVKYFIHDAEQLYFQ